MKESWKTYVFVALLLAGLTGVFWIGNVQRDANALPLPTANSEAVKPSKPPKKKVGMVDADLIRVGISNDAMTEMEYLHASVSASGPYKITNADKTQTHFEGAANQKVDVSKTKQGFMLTQPNGTKIGPVKGPLKVFTVTASDMLHIPSITRKQKLPSYRGEFELTAGYSSPLKFTVVNILPIHDYLKAVVPNELPPSFGYEAVKAQSVAARNYAIRPRSNPWPQFDICDSQFCQAYYGATTEHPSSNKALQETHGLVALYGGEPILALYSSSHGGYSENYENAFSDPETKIFPAQPLPYLRGTPDRGVARDLSNESAARAFYTDGNVFSYDSISSLYRWDKSWSRSELERTINKNLIEVSQDTLTKDFVTPHLKPGQTIGTLKRLNVKRRGVSGKIMALDIVGSNGTWSLQKEFVIRKVLQHGGRFLPSANVVFDHLTNGTGDLITIKAHGGGFGHGVGMSQYGASYMSKHGKNFVDIIQHYYKGTSLGSIPLTATEQQSMKTTFYGAAPTGILHVETTGKDPVSVKLNGMLLTLDPNLLGKATRSVDNSLKAGEINELMLLPPKDPDDEIKAWVELFPRSTN